MLLDGPVVAYNLAMVLVDGAALAWLARRPRASGGGAAAAVLGAGSLLAVALGPVVGPFGLLGLLAWGVFAHVTLVAARRSSSTAAAAGGPPPSPPPASSSSPPWPSTPSSSSRAGWR